MMKKMLALVLALALMAVPVLGSAATAGEIMAAAKDSGKATRTQLTFEAGDLTMFLSEEYQAIYSDVLKALGVNVYAHDQDSKVAVSLQGTEVLNLDMALDENGTFYLNSNFLGKDTVAVDPDEWQPLLEKLIQLMVDAGALSTLEGNQLKSMLPEMFETRAAAPTEEELLAGMDLTPVLEKLLTLAAGAKTEAVTEQPADCDTAASKLTFTLTPQDVTELHSLWVECIKDNDTLVQYMDSQLKQSGVSFTDLLDEMTEGIKETASFIQNTVVECHLDAEGGLVRIQVVLKLTDEGEIVELPITYTRKTTPMGVQHDLVLVDVDDGQMSLTVSGTYLDAGDAGLVSVIMKAGDPEGSLALNIDCVFDEKNVDFSMKMSGVEDGEAFAMDMKMVGEDGDTADTGKITLDVTADGETINLEFGISSEHTPGDTEASSKGVAEFAMTYGGVTLKLSGDYALSARTTALGAEQELVCDLKFSVLGMEIPLMTVKALTESCEVEPSVMSDSALHPAAMTDAELDAWGAKVAQSAQIAVIGLVQKLPVSVLSLVMGL